MLAFECGTLARNGLCAYKILHSWADLKVNSPEDKAEPKPPQLNIRRVQMHHRTEDDFSQGLQKTGELVYASWCI